MAHETTPDFCELCGRTGPVTEMDLLENPYMAMGFPVICGNDCYMLPIMTMPLYAKILNLKQRLKVITPAWSCQELSSSSSFKLSSGVCALLTMLTQVFTIQPDSDSDSF